MAEFDIGAENRQAPPSEFGDALMEVWLRRQMESHASSVPPTQRGGGGGSLPVPHGDPYAPPASLASNTGSAAGATGAAGAAGTGAAIDRIANYARLALGAAGTIRAATAGTPPTSSPEMERLLALLRDRLVASNPLYEALLRSTFGRLPTTATSGLTAPSMQLAATQVPPVSQGGNFTESQGARDLAREQEIRLRAGEPVYQAIQRLAMSRQR